MNISWWFKWMVPLSSFLSRHVDFLDVLKNYQARPSSFGHVYRKQTFFKLDENQKVLHDNNLFIIQWKLISLKLKNDFSIKNICTVRPWDARFLGNGKIRVAQNSCNLSYLIRQLQEHEKIVQLKVFTT